MPSHRRSLRGAHQQCAQFGHRSGHGLGADHQTGWTGLVAKTIQLYGMMDSEKLLKVGKQAGFVQGDPGKGNKKR